MRRISNTLNNAFGQRQVGTIYNPLNQYRVVMEAAPAHTCRTLELRADPGQRRTARKVPLAAFARIEPPMPLSVNHQGGTAASTISFSLPPGRVAGEATEAINNAMAGIGVPVHPMPASRARPGPSSNRWQPAAADPGAIITIYLVLGILYESLIHPITILSTLPSAGVGALLALMVQHRVRPDRHHRRDPADRHRQEERHHDDRLRAGDAPRTGGTCRRDAGHPRRLPAALRPILMTTAGGHVRRAAAGHRQRRWRRAAPAAGHRPSSAACGEPVADALHHAGQPTLGAGLTAQRSSSPPQQEAGNNFGLSASASWEVDLWGRLAGAVDASQARLEASWADLAAARLSLQATLTQSYLAVRHAQAQAQAVQSAVAGYQRSLQLTRNRYQAGVASAADVAQAETQLKSAQVQLLEWQITRAQLEHAIATLLGQAPASFTLEAARVPSTLPDAPAVPLQLPAQLLERRPDIAAAERRVAAAWAQVGVADAAFFPSLTLQASTGFRNDRLQSLIGAPNFLWSFGPQLALAALDGGARQSASDSARASAEQATSAYRQVVLTALQEVEDNLVAVARLDQEQALQAEALASARKALEVVTNQYQAGTVSYLNVVAAQSTALSSEQNLLNVRNRRLAATNTLLKNLAGRWEPLPAPVPDLSKSERGLDRDETRLVD
jgi:NodT family efflux transporter outer membrane factor (OMF) lipoprotein